MRCSSRISKQWQWGRISFPPSWIMSKVSSLGDLKMSSQHTWHETAAYWRCHSMRKRTPALSVEMLSASLFFFAFMSRKKDAESYFLWCCQIIWGHVSFVIDQSDQKYRDNSLSLIHNARYSLPHHFLCENSSFKDQLLALCC